MQTDLRGRDYISDMDFSKEEIETVLDVAFKLKRDRALGIPHPLLRDKALALLFFFSSTRTRSSFEVGMAQMGGHAAFIDSDTTQISHGDTAKEIGAMLGLSSKTVDVHRSRIRTKLDLATTPDLTHYAVRWVQAKDGGANL